MSTATASLPRTAGNGVALIVVVADFVMGLLEKGKATPVTKAAPRVIAAKKAETLEVWKLYRLSAGSDSISPKLAAKVRTIAAKN